MPESTDPSSNPSPGGFVLFPRLLLAAVLLMALGIAAWSEPLLEVKRQSVPTNTLSPAISMTPGVTIQASFTPQGPTPTPLPTLTPTFDVAVENTRTNGIILWGIIMVVIILGGTLSVSARFRR
jgi:hypothetical protein